MIVYGVSKIKTRGTVKSNIVRREYITNVDFHMPIAFM